MDITSDFRKFSPDDYLKEYYTAIGPENKFLLKFFHDCYWNIPPQKRLVEIGGGPTIYQLISASSRVDEIVFKEYLEANIDTINKWINQEPGAFNWEPYFDYVQSLEEKEGKPISLAGIRHRLRSRITGVQQIDIFSENPMGGEDFDITSVNFCPESITKDEEQFKKALYNIISPVKPEKYLLMTMLKNAVMYKVGKLFFYAFPVNEEYIKAILEKEDFNIIKIASAASENGNDYPELFGIFAQKN